jgi:hypothetical protein
MKNVKGTEAFVGTLLMLAGVLNLAFGIAAVANSHFYVGDTHYLFSSLHTWGWIVIILGIVQITASLSLFGGGTYGRVVGLIAAFIGAIGALTNTGGTHPWWSLGGFAICLILHLQAHGTRTREHTTNKAGRSLTSACGRPSRSPGASRNTRDKIVRRHPGQRRKPLLAVRDLPTTVQTRTPACRFAAACASVRLGLLSGSVERNPRRDRKSERPRTNADLDILAPWFA